jgi:hypothetical protein
MHPPPVADSTQLPGLSTRLTSGFFGSLLSEAWIESPRNTSSGEKRVSGDWDNHSAHEIIWVA